MDLPRFPLDDALPLILASGSPRRRELLTSAGYRFRVVVPDESAECGMCSRETPPELVARLAFQKAQDVARKTSHGLILAADTVAECRGTILGKPEDRERAREMLSLLRGRDHAVYTGVCLWRVPDDRVLVDVSVTQLRMEAIDDGRLEQYLDSGQWQGKAGAFGYQDHIEWLQVIKGSESNVVGLPMERLVELLRDFDQKSHPVEKD